MGNPHRNRIPNNQPHRWISRISCKHSRIIRNLPRRPSNRTSIQPCRNLIDASWHFCSLSNRQKSFLFKKPKQQHNLQRQMGCNCSCSGHSDQSRIHVSCSILCTAPTATNRLFIPVGCNNRLVAVCSILQRNTGALHYTNRFHNCTKSPKSPASNPAATSKMPHSNAKIKTKVRNLRILPVP